MDHAAHFVITRAHEQAELWVQVSVRFTHWTLVVHGLDDMATVNGKVGQKAARETLTKYSDVLPETSLTPPLNTIEEEVCV